MTVRATAVRLWLVVACLLAAIPVAHNDPAQAAERRTLAIGGVEEPDTLNPLLTQTAVGQAIDSAIFDGLLRVDGRNRLLPALASSWLRSRDGKIWTFHLRHARFADGVDLTSTDVYWTYLSILNPNNHVANRPGWDQVQSMGTPDRFTVVMRLKQAQARWLREIGVTPILPKHALFRLPTIDVPSFGRRPFGTGPYRVGAWEPGTQITLTANQSSWQGAPHIATIVYRFYPDDPRLLAALSAGTIDMGAIDADQAAAAYRLKGSMLVVTPSMTWYHVDLKQWGFLRDKGVRQALDYATPKSEIVRRVLHGFGRVATGDIAPVLPGFYPAVPAHPHDPRRAAAILAAAGYRRGPRGILRRCSAAQGCTTLQVTLWSVTGDAIANKVNVLLARAWGAIGISAILREAPAAQVFGPVGPQFQPQATGITYGWANGDDPDDRYYWNSASIPTSPSAGGGNDVAYFHRFSFQRRLDALTEAAASGRDPAARRALYARIERLLADQVPAIFLYWPCSLTVAPRGLSGFAPSPFTSLFWNVAHWR